MKIVTAPHAILVSPSRPVLKINQKIKELVRAMTKTLISQTDPEGVGLAATQVGMPLRLFIIKKNKKAPVKVFINPNVLKPSQTPDPQPQTPNEEEKHPTRLEGCLSIPKIWGNVTRAKKVTLEYSDIDGKITTENFSGFEATIIEHEMDHLEGVLFTRRVLEQGNQLYREEDGELVKYEI